VATGITLDTEVSAQSLLELIQRCRPKKVQKSEHSLRLVAPAQRPNEAVVHQPAKVELLLVQEVSIGENTAFNGDK
jgi:hypothetical protein